MRISVSSDVDEPVARAPVAERRGRGRTAVAHGALRPGGATGRTYRAGTTAHAAAGAPVDRKSTARTDRIAEDAR